MFLKKRDEAMFISCRYCGRIHRQGEECKLKPKRKYYKKKLTEENKEIQRFRWSKQWQHKRENIKKRDNYMCIACLLGLKCTAKRLNTIGLSVHHIVPLAVDFDKRLDDDNLITLCSLHHSMADSGEIDADTLIKAIT